MTVHAVTARDLDPHRIGEANIAASRRRCAAATWRIRETLAERIVEIAYADIRADAPGCCRKTLSSMPVFPSTMPVEAAAFAILPPPIRSTSHGAHRYKPREFRHDSIGDPAPVSGDFAELSSTRRRLIAPDGCG